RDPILDSPWFWVHVSSLLFAYASLALAAVLGLTYIVQFKEIKKKHLGYFYTRLPSLQKLDVMNARAIAVGWLFLTIGLVSGAVWAAQARAVVPDDPNLQAMSSLVDPKILFAVVAWAVYSFAVLARPPHGEAVGLRLRHRPPQPRPHQLLRHHKPYVLGDVGVHLFLIGVSHRT